MTKKSYEVTAKDIRQNNNKNLRLGFEMIIKKMFTQALSNVKTKGGLKMEINGRMVNIPAKPYEDAFWLLTSKDNELTILAKADAQYWYEILDKQVRQSYGFRDLEKIIDSGSDEGRELKKQLELYGVLI